MVQCVQFLEMSLFSTRANSSGKGPEDQTWIAPMLVSMVVLSIVSVAARLLSRHIRRQKLWWDDWMCIFALFWSFGTATCLWMIRNQGLGYHISDIEPEHLPHFFISLLVDEIVYCWNTVFVKIALLLLYYRLLQVSFQTSRTLRAAAYTIAALVIIHATIFSFTAIFMCVPVQKAWVPSLPGHCSSAIPWTFSIISSIFTDLAILVLPVPQIWQMRLGTMEKAGVILTLALGCAVAAITSYRLPLSLTVTFSDLSYTVTPVAVWGYIEVATGILCTCLPVSKPVLLWATSKIGLTGEHGCIQRLRDSVSGSTSTAKSGDDVEPTIQARQSPIRDGRCPSSHTRGFSKYFAPGDRALFHAMDNEARLDSPRTSKYARGGERADTEKGLEGGLVGEEQFLEPGSNAGEAFGIPRT